jgi:O-acetyl-ADP-ribose deacetylase (regulator of RNase III)
MWINTVNALIKKEKLFCKRYIFVDKTMESVYGSILEAKVDVIVHQCNCVTTKAKGLSAQIYSLYPYSDIYTKDIKRFPGKCIVSFAPYKDVAIASLMGQIAPGKSGEWSTIYNIDPLLDTASRRLEYFEQALTELEQICITNNLKSIAFPYKIGCGLAGGHWPDYLALISKFQKRVATNNIKVAIYQQQF